jgi:hypothetical protein
VTSSISTLVTGVKVRDAASQVSPPTAYNLPLTAAQQM